MGETGVAEKKALKPGWQTTEFWVTVVAMLLPQVDSLPPTWRAALTVGASAVYAIGRALTKIGLGGK